MHPKLFQRPAAPLEAAPGFLSHRTSLQQHELVTKSSRTSPEICRVEDETATESCKPAQRALLLLQHEPPQPAALAAPCRLPPEPVGGLGLAAHAHMRFGSYAASRVACMQAYEQRSTQYFRGWCMGAEPAAAPPAAASPRAQQTAVHGAPPPSHATCVITTQIRMCARAHRPSPRPVLTVCRHACAWPSPGDRGRAGPPGSSRAA